MKRQIKFKVWDNQLNLFHKTNSHNSIKLDREFILQQEEFLDYLQFTGLKDKNGKDIYMGDILEIESGNPMIVSWSDRFASFVLARKDWAFRHWFGESCNPEDCIIVGNIYENPELCK